MENLLRQREELLEKIRRIAEACEGLENEENARRVTELNTRQAELLAQKDDLKSKLAALEGELGTIGKNILDLSGSGVEKILQAIKNQRWYFFKNKPKVLMDRDTALLWNNLNYLLEDNRSESNYYDLNDALRLIENISLDDYKNWHVVKRSDFEKLTNSNTGFPFYRNNERRLWSFNLSNGNLSEYSMALIDFDHNGTITARWIDSDYSKINGTRGLLLVYSDDLVPTDYENNISPSNNFYTETEKLQFTLDIFVQNELIPLFNDEAITQLYRQIFVEKPALMKQLAEIEAQLAEMQTSQVKLTANFDYRPLLKKFDATEIDKSVIKYSAAVLRVTDELIEILSEYEAAQEETIAEFLKIALKLKAKFTDNPNLTPEENSLLAERQKFLAERLELGTDAVKAQILSVKAQAEELSARLDKINREPNSIRQLAELQAEPRANFELLVENLAQIIKAAQQRVDFFAQNKNLVANVVNSHAAWTDSYKTFKTSLREELSAACREDAVDEEIFAAWYDDWQAKRFAIEQRFLPLIEFALKGNLLESIGRVLDILQSYREAVDKFYLHERKNIYQKFAFTAGGDLQEKFETESELYKLAEKLQRDLQEIIFSSGTEERIFLLRWSEPLLNIPIDEISNFIRDKELDAISEEVLTQFAALKRQNFAVYIADSKAYSEAVQNREKEFNALIFRMRKDLHKS